MKSDVVIIGAGPAGSATAMYLQRLGIESIVVEKSEFPRFHIGESFTGEAARRLRDLGFGDAMDASDWPKKRGVRVFGPNGKSAFWVPVMSVAQDGELEIANTWHARRSDFDKMLLERALSNGSTLIAGKAKKTLFDEQGAVSGLEVILEDGSAETIACKVIVDATGLATFFSNTGLASPKTRGHYDRQVAIYSHFSGDVKDLGAEKTIIFYQKLNHWAWFIPIDSKTVSVGITVPADYFRSTGESVNDFFVREVKELNPALTERIQNATLIEEVRAVSNYSYGVKNYTGKGWLCVGDSHNFIDPIFSFGVHVCLAEAEFAAAAIDKYLSGETASEENPFAAYEQETQAGQDLLQDVVDAFWEEPLKFAFAIHHRFVDDFVNVFAGRIYSDYQPSEGVLALQQILATSRAQMQPAL